ncbi:glycoside hydrolase family 127 protein [Xylanibacter oryzae]|uniref:glycoside hydrolase family 127 protein n=1 Tax=Xylanibacter oryzae TaxID=185293 RepID=UPI0004BA7712|nr:glycoside hydrolase family 127 protein [Xylanibacter oryzae]
MKRLISSIILGTLAVGCLQAKTNKPTGYPISQVPFTSVNVTPGTFWGQRLKAAREVTVPLAFSKCKETGRYDNFIKAAHPGTNNIFHGFTFDDTDVYKTIEGASYILQTYPDKKMKAYIDSVLNIVAAAQEPDGYLYTARTMNPSNPPDWAGPKRWSNEEILSHELYNLGHMVDGAVAHYQATGSRKFLDIAIRYADCVCREVGPNLGQACVVPGHQIAEMALSRLYLVTGNKKYLDEAKFFLDYRGKTNRKDFYSQSSKPIVEQKEAVGHAVRAGYMYSGIADVAALTGDSAYIKTIDAIWNNIVSKKYYITGGVGARHAGEAFGDNYELPNLTAYNETCAAIAQVYLNQRMFLLHGDSKYIDCLERSLYNGVIDGMSIDGGKFFYPNPLACDGVYRFNADNTLERQPWFGCACCPSNLCRFIPSLPGYLYAVKDNNIYINLFAGNKSTIDVNGKKVSFEEKTEYPWNGDISIAVTGTKTSDFNMMVRIPGWVQNQVVPSDLYSYNDGKNLSYSIRVNGQQLKQEALDNGYFKIARKWKEGDKVNIHFDMQPRTVVANNKVEADRGRVAIERGPLVYCAEWPYNDFDVFKVIIGNNLDFKVVNKPQMLNGINEITADAQALSTDSNGKVEVMDVKLTLIPYYCWNHKGPGKMEVWMNKGLQTLDAK